MIIHYWFACWNYNSWHIRRKMSFAITFFFLSLFLSFSITTLSLHHFSFYWAFLFEHLLKFLDSSIQQTSLKYYVLQQQHCHQYCNQHISNHWFFITFHGLFFVKIPTWFSLGTAAAFGTYTIARRLDAPVQFTMECLCFFHCTSFVLDLFRTASQLDIFLNFQLYHLRLQILKKYWFYLVFMAFNIERSLSYINVFFFQVIIVVSIVWYILFWFQFFN